MGDTTTLCDAIRTSAAVAGTVYRDRAPTGCDLSPPYGVMKVALHINTDGLTALVDVTIDVWGYDDVAAVESLCDGIDEQLRGKVHTTGATALWRTNMIVIGEDDPRIVRRQIAYTGSWASPSMAATLDPNGAS